VVHDWDPYGKSVFLDDPRDNLAELEKRNECMEHKHKQE
jgi:hypothetical protein